MREKIKSLIMLFAATIIWGFAFVAQSKGMDYVGGFTFNCLRCFLGPYRIKKEKVRKTEIT